MPPTWGALIPFTVYDAKPLDLTGILGYSVRMYAISTHHTNYISDPDTVTIAQVDGHTDKEITRFAVQYSHDGNLSSYWGARVQRWDNGNATVYFSKD